MDPVYAKKIGVKLHLLDLGEPDCGEEGFEMIEWAISEGHDLVVVDSVAAMTPLSEIEGNIGDANMGAHGRLMGQGLRRVTNLLKKDVPTSILFINQIRTKLGVVFGNPETTPGGRALKFFASVRIDLRDPRMQKITEGKVEVGKKINAKTVKNKIYSPFKTCKIYLTYGKGVNKGRDLVQALVERDMATATKNTVIVKGYRQMNYSTFLERLKKDNSFLSLLIDDKLNPERS